MPALLEGIRVLDLSRVVAGPYCAMLMADLGADVVKLERPGRGDDLRDFGGARGMSAVFAAINRGKRGIAIDLQSAEGARLALELARRTDVIIENFLAGAAERLGLGYAAVRAVNPGVVYASITGFGQTGPYAKRPGYNTIAQGMSGLMALTGMPGHPPTRVAGSASDTAASLVAFGAINAALVGRARTGNGAHLDVSLLASSLGLLPDPVAHYLESGVRPQRHGNRNPNLTPAEAFQTRDGFITIVLMNAEQWTRFCAVIGDPALASARFQTNTDRLQHHAELKERVERVLATATTADWVERFEAASIASGPIYELDEVFADPQVKHLGLIAKMEQPGYGPMRMLGFPFATSGARPDVRRPAPLLGEHTEEVLGDLGLTRGEIERLSAAGVIQLGPPGRPS
jgi:crotonobetainyl-CoA:carnitine CoA-transferase CaiB-like acyl-CoA transferase